MFPTLKAVLFAIFDQDAIRLRNDSFNRLLLSVTQPLHILSMQYQSCPDSIHHAAAWTCSGRDDSETAHHGWVVPSLVESLLRRQDLCSPAYFADVAKPPLEMRWSVISVHLIEDPFG